MRLYPLNLTVRNRPLLLCFFFLGFFSLQAQFSPGRLVVLQAGDGSSAPSSNGNPILLKEYATSGTPGYSMAVPSTGTNALILRGSATSEGYISLSADANYIVVGGYAQSLPNSNPLNSSAASSVNRGIGLFGASGSYILAAIGNTTFANGDMRGATATGSNNLWGSSSSAGTAYYGSASAQGNVQNSKTNLRAIHIFNGQLYISSQVSSGTPSVIGIYSVGTGTPVSTSQTVSTVINTGTGSQPGQFYFNSANTICYVADARNSAQGGIQKWVYSAGSWSLAYTLPTGTAAIGAFGVVADFSGLNPVVYATTTETLGARLVAINDIGSSATATTLATNTTSNSVFRGLCFSPGTSPCNTPVVTGIITNSAQCSQDTLILTPAVSGTAPFTYTWSGVGVFSSTSSVNPKITNSASGAYTLQVSNACGTSTAVVNVTINPSPTLQVNAPTVCTGGTATLTVSGASTYTWNTGSNSSSFTVSPLGNTTYTVSGTSAQGCLSGAVTTTVSLTSSLVITANSATVCAGSGATLHASGASTYTWSTNSNASSIVVTPSVTSSYTVSGSAPGCPNSASTAVNVSVVALPSVSISSPFTVVCVTEVIFAINGSPSGGTFSGTGMNGNQFSPALAGIGTHTISYVYTAGNSCSNIAVQTITVTSCAGLQSEENNSEWRIFPNPVKDELKLSGLSNGAELDIRIVNLYGQEIKAQRITNNSVSVENLLPGLYFLEFSQGSEMHRIKFIKE